MKRFMSISFTGKTWKFGRSTVVTIPGDYVKNNIVKRGKYYKFVIEGDTNDGND